MSYQGNFDEENHLIDDLCSQNFIKNDDSNLRLKSKNFDWQVSILALACLSIVSIISYFKNSNNHINSITSSFIDFGENAIQAKIISRQTPSNFDGDITYLDRHRLDCRPMNGPLTQFLLKSSGVGYISYDYSW